MTGRIAYRYRGTSEAWGFEEFAITRDVDGNRTLVAHCEMELDGKAVVRESTLTIDQDYQPVDAFVRTLNSGRHTGSGWFRFANGAAESENWSKEFGRQSQSEAITPPLRGFGIHALIGDGWLAAAYPNEKGQGSEHFWGSNPVCSLDHLGATGPQLEFSTSGFRYDGEEEVTTPAGTFACYKYWMIGIVNDHPPYAFWITTDDDRLYVRGEVDGYMDSYFELEELSR